MFVLIPTERLQLPLNLKPSFAYGNTQRKVLPYYLICHLSSSDFLALYQGKQCCQKYIDHTFANAHFCICDHNSLVTAVYMKVLEEEKANIDL